MNPITQDQLDAWAEYQRARSAMGLLTDAEYASLFGRTEETR